jgi:gluconate 2-dehydrogenase gamma chain
VVDRIFPSDDLGPGAREAGVVTYIDRSLAEWFADDLELFQACLIELDHSASERFGKPFANLEKEQQDQMMAEAERGAVQPGGLDLSRFFDKVVMRTREGMFCDPSYGGNRDKIGWRLLGMPGYQESFTEEEARLDASPRPRRPLALADIGFAPRNGHLSTRDSQEDDS